MADYISPGDSYAAPKVNWNDPALNGIDRIQYYATSGQVVGVAERPMPVTLALTREEAETLADILASIGGCPDKSRRRYTESVLRTLSNHGFDWRDRSDIAGDIMFEDIE